MIYFNNNIYNQASQTLFNKVSRSLLESNKYTWENCLTGFLKKKIAFNINHSSCYEFAELYAGTNYDAMEDYKAIMDIVDSSEIEFAMVCTSPHYIENNKNIAFTHMELHPSLMFGVMGNQVILPEHNQLPRNLFGCGQAKQAASIYHSNFMNRIDKMGLILNYGQIPLLKSRYLSLIHKEEHPCGENAMVAIMCHSGFNVEDAILINQGSLQRGLFQTTYLNMYETREESSSIGKSTTDFRVRKIDNTMVTRLKPGYNYNELDENGIIKENTPMDDKTVLIGRTVSNINTPDSYEDASIFPKKGQLGYVDKAYMTDGDEGFRLVKIRIREQRTPAMGDKFCSRCGQKGTIGLIIPEENMPFNKEGIRPDIIVNPHAIPSRMTIGQLIETIMGKACIDIGAFGDSTAFVNTGPKHLLYSNLLRNCGFHSSGNEVMYNGLTGEQIEANIFFGPTYYMRLKHMVKDKINYRARGPRTLLTRQTVHGRANDGGLRIGEMERDVVVAHGMSCFVNDSLMNRGDEYYMAICNVTGMIAIYNEEKNLFMSPCADGPLKYNGTISDELNVIQVTKYGRSFSVIKVPYAFKLLMQELSSMNVQMRIITEDTISQIDNMGYGKYVDLNINPKKKPLSQKKSHIIEVSPEQEKQEPKKEELNLVYTAPKYDTGSKVDDENEDEEEDDDDTFKPELPAGLMPWIFNSEDDYYYSAILNKDGEATDIWLEQYPPKPNLYPDEWKHDEIKSLKLDERKVTELLMKHQIPNNWNFVIDMLKTETNSVVPNEIKEIDTPSITQPLQIHPLGLPSTMNQTENKPHTPTESPPTTVVENTTSSQTPPIILQSPAGTVTYSPPYTVNSPSSSEQTEDIPNISILDKEEDDEQKNDEQKEELQFFIKHTTKKKGILFKEEEEEKNEEIEGLEKEKKISFDS